MHGSRSRLYLIENDVDDDDNDDAAAAADDDKDHYSWNSVNFKVMTSRFCMEVDIDNTYLMLKYMPFFKCHT